MCVVGNKKNQGCIQLNGIDTTETMTTAPSIVTSKPRISRRRISATSSTSSCAIRRANRTYVEHTYQDHYEDPLFRPGYDDEEDAVEGAKRRGPRGGVVVPFPERLYSMLGQVEADGDEDVVSWQSHGRCFVVHQPKLFVADVMPKYFRQSKLTSFQRQVNLYGFRRITAGKDRGGYYHPMFLRGRQDLHKALVRIRVKGTGFKSASSPATEPNFYSYQRCTEGPSEMQLVTAEGSAMPDLAVSVPLTGEDDPVDPVWMPLGAPPKMVVSPQMSPLESPTLVSFDEFCMTSGDAPKPWNVNARSSSQITLSSMAQSLVETEHGSWTQQAPCPVTPESNVRKLISTGLEHALATVSPVDSPAPSPFPSMAVFDIPQHMEDLLVTPLPQSSGDFRMDTFEADVDALLSVDTWFNEDVVVENTLSSSEYSLDPLFLLDEIVGSV